MWPLLSDVVAMLGYRGVFMAALAAAGHATRAEQAELAELSDFTGGGRAGQMPDAARVKRERRRDLKLMRWFPERSSQFKSMLFSLRGQRAHAAALYFPQARPGGPARPRREPLLQAVRPRSVAGRRGLRWLSRLTLPLLEARIIWGP